jgi:hypothetical protein
MSRKLFFLGRSKGAQGVLEIRMMLIAEVEGSSPPLTTIKSMSYERRLVLVFRRAVRRAVPAAAVAFLAHTVSFGSYPPSGERKHLLFIAGSQEGQQLRHESPVILKQKPVAGIRVDN